jgi:porin
VFIPALNKPLALESNAWTFDFTFDQYLIWDPATKTGIGLFGMIGASDSNPSPVDIFGHIGVGGNSPIPKRSQDNFGVGYYFNGISNTLEETLAPLFRTRDENGFEGFYNFAVTGWSKVTADVQFVDPFSVGSKTRGFFSIRWKLAF